MAYDNWFSVTEVQGLLVRARLRCDESWKSVIEVYGELQKPYLGGWIPGSALLRSIESGKRLIEKARSGLLRCMIPISA